MANQHHVSDRVARCTKSKNQIAVMRCMGGHGGAPNAVMCGNRDTLALRFCQRRVGGDNGNGGVFAVNINESNDKIWLKITDNEQSFAQFNSKINFDMAMYYIRQIANKFNATFHTYDNQEHGSEIIISIPLMKIS